MERVCIDKVLLDPVTMNEAVVRVSTMLEEPRERAAHVVTMNAQFVEIAHQEERFADLLRRADLSVADGLSLVWASRWLGKFVPERVAGADLMMRLCETAASKGKTVYFLGGSPGAAACAAGRLSQELPRLAIVGVDCPPKGFLDNPDECARVANRIESARPDLLFVGLGAPKQEYWIEQYSYLPAKVMMGIGGSFEFVAGFRKRAPLLVQKSRALSGFGVYVWSRAVCGDDILSEIPSSFSWCSGNGGASRLPGPPIVQPKVRQPTREKQTSNEGHFEVKAKWKTRVAKGGCGS